MEKASGWDEAHDCVWAIVQAKEGVLFLGGVWEVCPFFWFFEMREGREGGSRQKEVRAFSLCGSVYLLSDSFSSE